MASTLISTENIPGTIYEISVKDLNGKDVKMETFKGKCLLIVNVASDCKLMKENLRKLREIKEKFVDDIFILLFPCNQFMGFSGKNDVASFVHEEKIDFAETLEMVEINGSDTHPLFTFLKAKRPGCISWNFAKFLVSKSGQQVERFNHRVLFSTIEKEIRQMME